MKIKFILKSAMVLAFVVFINSCSDDKESAPKQQLAINGNAVSLKGANISLTYSTSCCGGIDYREYAISDGEFTNDAGNNGWSLGDYTNATYFMMIQLAVPSGSDFEAGEYPLYYSFSEAVTDESNASYVYYESAADDETYFYCDTPSETTHPSVVVTGGFADGDKMTLKFSGNLEIEYFDGMNWVDDEMKGSFYVTGTVSDERAPM